MKHRRALVLLVVAALVSLFAIPAGATRPGTERFSLMAKGTGAQVTWVAPGFPQTAPEAGTPFVFVLMGYRTPGMLQKQLSSTSKPEIWKMPALLAMGIEGVGEVWCVPSKAESTFTISRDLTEASLRFATDCEVVSGEDEPTGETIPVAVTATWVGTGELAREKSVTKMAEAGFWAIDRIHSATRPGAAHVSIVRTDVAGSAGVLFDDDVVNTVPVDGPSSDVSLFRSAEGHLSFVTVEG